VLLYLEADEGAPPGTEDNNWANFDQFDKLNRYSPIRSPLPKLVVPAISPIAARRRMTTGSCLGFRVRSSEAFRTTEKSLLVLSRFS